LLDYLTGIMAMRLDWAGLDDGTIFLQEKDEGTK
jgi:hypothetical protein